LKNSAKLGAALALFAALTMVPTGRAQNYGPWSAPVNLNALTLSDGTLCPAVVNSAADDQHPAMSKDGLSLYFTSNRPGGSGNLDLWVTQRDSLDDCWLPAVNLGPVVNSPSLESAPNLTTDGHWLYFHSKRPTWITADGVEVPNCGGVEVDLYVSHRQDKRDDLGWENPINLGCTINTPGFDHAGPTYFEDDATGTHYLYYTQRPFGASDVLFDIYVSTCPATADLAACNTQGLWGLGRLVDALNNTPDNKEYRNTRTAIRRRDGLEMILSSGRPGSLGSENLWVSTRATTQDQNWLTPVPINCDSMLGCPAWDPDGPLVNSNAFDGAPALSWDGTELYFFSKRTDLSGHIPGLSPAGDGTENSDLYVSKRTKLTGPQ
jgi:WD40-like Beta Propeller Repeat